MYRTILLSFILLFFTACNENKPTKKYDAKKLLEQKCASCHDINMPPVVSDDELAPPMMAVSFHVRNFVKPSDESQRTSKAIEFVVDYVNYPSVEKSFCDKESLKRYGLMPSQKDNLSKDETKAIANYMFKHFTQENLSKIQKDIATYNALSQGQKLAIKHRCSGCHKRDKKIVGPSLNDIAKKYANSKEIIHKSIRNGSRGIWEKSNGAVMPPFKQIDEKDMKILVEWIYED